MFTPASETGYKTATLPIPSVDFPLNYGESPVVDLVAALFLPSDQPMAMFSFYGDASGSDDTALIAVAGFIASAENWIKFEKDWKPALREFGVSYLHMREFAHSVGEFEGWKGKELKRRAFLTRMEGVIAAHAEYWVGTCILAKDYESANRVYQLRETIHPFPFAGLAAFSLAEKWRKVHDLPQRAIEYVFDRGDKHRGELFKAIGDQTGRDPIFRDKKKFPPLQAADFAAYELFKAYTELRVNVDQIFIKLRESFRLLKNITCRWGDYNEQAIRVMCRTMNIPRR